MQSLNGFDCELEDVENQRCESINTDINNENDYTDTYSIQQPTPNPYTNTEWNGYKVVKDKFDKNIRPSFQRVNRRTLSTHYCHVYAVKAHVNLSSLPNARPEIDSSLNPMDILPTNDDLVKLKEEFYIITSRYVCTYVFIVLYCYYNTYYGVSVQHIEQFLGQGKDVQWHIESSYKDKMSIKSEVVCT